MICFQKQCLRTILLSLFKLFCVTNMFVVVLLFLLVLCLISIIVFTSPFIDIHSFVKWCTKALFLSLILPVLFSFNIPNWCVCSIKSYIKEPIALDFLIFQTNDLFSNRDKDKYAYAKNRDHLMISFKYDLCLFYNLKGSDPQVINEGTLLLKTKQWHTLNYFWFRDLVQ